MQESGITGRRGYRLHRIGIVTSWNVRCGIAEYSAFLAEAFRRDGLEVCIFSDAAARAVRPDDQYVSRPWRNDLETVSRLVSDIRSKCVDAVLLEHHPGFYSGAVLGALTSQLRACGLPVLICPHLVQHDHFDAAALAGSLHGAAIQVHRESDKTYLESRGVSNVTVIPHGIYVAGNDVGCTFDPVSFEGDITLGSFGFLMPHKGFLELLAACALLRRRIPRLRLNLYCSMYPSNSSSAFGTRLEAFRRCASAESWCSIDMTFHDNDQVLENLAACTALVFGYQYTPESSSAAVRMALAARRPTICTPIPIFDDVRKCVFTADGTDPFSISNAIWALLRDGLELRRLARAQSELLEACCWSSVSRQIVSTISRNPVCSVQDNAAVSLLPRDANLLPLLTSVRGQNAGV